MKLATVEDGDGPVAVAMDDERGVVRLRDLAEPVPGTAMDALGAVSAAELRRRVEATPDERFGELGERRVLAPYRHPRKLWGIGLNYREHADDLTADYPEEPASFIKGDHTIIGPGDPIPLPAQSERVTAEAELGLVIGTECRNVTVEKALDYLWGVCPVLDQTAEDILQRNPRFLTRSKNFPGFFSFGPIVPLDEVGELAAIEVATVKNGEVHRANTVSEMFFDPATLVAFHSQVMPLFPGDIISSGTPGAVVIRAGDVAECRIPGVGTLVNPVV
jgi:2-keto-4-pentenoate hydratase/2-oxohepta-3-ene-1,7-dioic acid hydratase in catechol pathway